MTGYTSGLDVNMEPYLLTIDDINALAESGMDMRNVKEGWRASQAEMEVLGTPTSTVAESTMSALNSPAPVTFNSQADDIAETMTPEELASLRTPTGNAPQALPPVSASNVQEVLGAGGVPASNTFTPAQAPSGQTVLQQALGLMAPQPVSNDPYENLSKTQRRMLAFSALSDAGSALAGRDANSYGKLMGQFNDFTDMQRKATAAQAQQQMFSGMFGEGAVGGEGTISARKQQAMMLLTNPATTALGQALLAQIAAEEQSALVTAGSVQSSVNTIETVVDLMDSIKDNPSATGFWGSILGNIPFTKAGEVRIDADTLRSNMALDALMNLKATGATLGSVSAPELKLLESDIAQLNLNQKQEAVLKDLEKIKGRYVDIIRKAYATGDPAALDTALGGRPSWLNETASPASTDGKTWNPETQRFE